MKRHTQTLRHSVWSSARTVELQATSHWRVVRKWADLSPLAEIYRWVLTAPSQMVDATDLVAMEMPRSRALCISASVIDAVGKATETAAKKRAEMARNCMLAVLFF